MTGHARARLLTGATDGIGLALARRWRSRSESCFLHGRRPLEELDERVFREGSYVRADLSDPKGPDQVVRFLNEHGVEEVELLVLNAGIGWYGPLSDQDAKEIRDLVEVDLLAPLRLCHLLLPRIERGGGRIVFISSVTSFLPCPLFATYAASKAAAEGFFRSLRVELEKRVEVQVLRPGAVRTAMHEKSGADPERIGWKRFPTPELIAAKIDRAISGPPVWRTLGATNRVLGSFGRNLPRLAERMQARRGR